MEGGGAEGRGTLRLGSSMAAISIAPPWRRAAGDGRSEFEGLKGLAKASINSDMEPPCPAGRGSRCDVCVVDDWKREVRFFGGVGLLLSRLRTLSRRSPNSGVMLEAYGVCGGRDESFLGASVESLAESGRRSTLEVLNGRAECAWSSSRVDAEHGNLER